MDDFADAPPTITELRACRSESAKDWTPRDALVALLRDIDAGKFEDIGPLVVIYSRKKDGLRRVGYSVASDSSLATLGLVARFTHDYIEGT